MAKRAIVGGNLLEIDGYDNLESPRVSKVGEPAFTEWNSSTSVWDVKLDTVFKNGLNTESFLKNYSYDLTQNTTSIINDLPADVRSKFWQENIFTPGIIGNGTTSENSESGSQQTGNTSNQQQSGNQPLSVNYRYPKKFSKEFDYLLITKYEYVPTGYTSTQLSGGGAFSPESVEKRMEKNSKGSVALPMQGISESNSVSWTGDSLNPIQAFFGKIAGKAIEDISTGNLFSLAGAGGMAQSVMEGLNQVSQSTDVQDFLTQYFAGQAVGANLVTRNTGLIVNPNLELLFQGPSLRTFSYSYRFNPRDDDEAREIRNIILFLKRGMAAKKGDINLFLKTPDVFKLKYIFGKTNNEHPFLNKIKLCALTSVNVDYSPDGNYMTYQDGSMTSYSVNLTFSELEPIYENDVPEPGTNSSTMGY